MKISRNLSIVFLLLAAPVFLFAQRPLIEEFLPINYPISEENVKYLDVYQKENRVAKLQLVKINTEIFKDEQVVVNLALESAIATRIQDRVRSDEDFSWFGTLEDESGIYFSVLEDQVMSKFRIGDYAYSIVPLDGDVHMLIEVNADAKHPEGHVGCIHDAISEQSQNHRPSQEHHHSEDRPEPSSQGGARTDTDCVYRISILYTDDAAANIVNLALFSQTLADEANLAYTLSQIDLVAEVARSLEVNHAESDVLIAFPGFANTTISTDVVRFRNNNDGVLDEIHDMRGRYQTDVQVLVRENIIDFGNGAGVFLGSAFGVAFDVDAANAADAFVAVQRASIPLNRFTFTHEIGHIQGAKHENDNNAPLFARGFLFANGAAGRTLMVRGAAGVCATANGDACRIGRFSNPNVVVGGTTIGVANNFDNARRLNETADRTRNYRMTNDVFTIAAEDIPNETLSHHLANDRLTTGGNTVTYQSGSIATMRAGQEVLLQNGAWIRDGSRFRAYIENDPCENPAPLPLNQPDEDLVEQRSENPAQAMNDQLMIQPNPARDFIVIAYRFDTPQTATTAIFDANGRVVQIIDNAVLRDAGEYQIEVDIQNLPAGFYYCQLQTEETKLTKKFIVNK